LIGGTDGGIGGGEGELLLAPSFRILMANNLIIKIENATSTIIGRVPDEVLDAIDERLSYKRKGVEYSPKVVEGEWDGRNHCFSKWYKTFPTGLCSLVAEVLSQHHIPWEYEDLRKRPHRNMDWKVILPHPISLFDFQRETADICEDVGRGICSLPTGSGKTMTFSVIIGELRVTPVIVYVPSLLLLDQTKAALERVIRNPGGSPVEVGVIGNGICDIRDINVMTVQTAITVYDKKYDRNKGCVRNLTRDEKVKRNKNKRRNLEDPDADEDLDFVRPNRPAIKKLIEGAQLVVADEAHRVSSAMYQEVLNNSKSAYYRFAFSATAYREDGTEILIQASFGRKLMDITCSELIRKGILVRPYIFSINVPPEPGTFESYQQAKKKCIVESHQRNLLIASLAEGLKTEGPMLLLVTEKRHGRVLEKLISDSKFIHAGDSKSVKEQAISDMLSGKLPALIATPIADEGLDLVQLKTLFLCDAGRSVTRLYQRIGRSLRICPNKEYSIVIDFRDTNDNLSDHVVDRKRVLMNEEEFVLIEVSAGRWKQMED